MKKLTLLFSCLLVFTMAYCQANDSIPSLSKEALLKKSRVQKTVGWFMVGTGVPVVLSCLYFMTFPDDVLSEKEKVAAAMVGGAVYTFIGIRLVQKGTKNKQRALSLRFGHQQVPVRLLTGAGFQRQPAVVLKLGL